MKIKTYILCLLTMMMASCVTSRRVNLLQEPGKNNIPEYTDTLTYEDYELRTGDRLYIYVYSVDERINKMFNASGAGVSSSMMRQNSMAGTGYDLYTYEVKSNGSITFPMVGDVYVRGLTTREVKKQIEQELSSFIKSYGDFQMISVEVNIVSRRFSVISDRGSGVFSIPKEKITIYEALAMAGDICDFGDRSKVRIVREKEGVTNIKTFDVRSKDIINSEFYYIEPNDVIYIQRIKGQSFGINSVTTSISVVATTLAFGGFVYGLVTRIINAVETQSE